MGANEHTREEVVAKLRQLEVKNSEDASLAGYVRSIGCKELKCAIGNWRTGTSARTDSASWFEANVTGGPVRPLLKGERGISARRYGYPLTAPQAILPPAFARSNASPPGSGTRKLAQI